MPGIATSEHTVKITVVEVGKEKRFVEIPEGSTGDKLLAALGGGDAKRVTINGQPVTEETTIDKPVSAFVGPRQVKQGR